MARWRDAGVSSPIEAIKQPSIGMEGGAAHVQELHRKFQALNEDVSAALRAQQDALAAVGAKGSAKKDTLRLATRAIDWREDVAALAKHIDGQLQHSRALRAHHASAQLPVNPDRQRADDEGARIRRLRSDLRLLHGLRVSLASPDKEEASSDPVEETVRIPTIKLTTATESLALRLCGAERVASVPRLECQAGEDRGRWSTCATCR